MVVAKSVNMFSPYKLPFLYLVSIFQRSSRLIFFRERIYKLYCTTGSRAARMDDRELFHPPPRPPSFLSHRQVALGLSYTPVPH